MVKRLSNGVKTKVYGTSTMTSVMFAKMAILSKAVAANTVNHSIIAIAVAPARTGAQVSLTVSRRQNRIRRRYHERATMSGQERSFRVTRHTVASWIKTCTGKPYLKDRLLPVDLRMCWKWMKCGLSKKDYQRGWVKKHGCVGKGNSERTPMKLWDSAWPVLLR